MPTPITESIRTGTDVRRALGLVRRLFEMPTAFIAELRNSDVDPDLGAHLVVRYVDGDTIAGRLAVGTRWPVDATVAGRVIDGGSSIAVPDLAADPELARGALAAELGAHAYVGVPLVLSSGTPYGVLCCFALHPDLGVRTRDGDVLRLVGDLITDGLERQQEELRTYGRTAAVIAGALRPGAITAAYQPIVEIGTRRIVGYEALARFARPPDWPPDLWFAAARSIGYGVELEVAAVRAALARRPRVPGRYLSLNVSPAALSSPELRAVMTEESDIDLGDVVFEVTEHESYDVGPALVAALADWRQAGARIAIDDAGSGYSGLNQVLHLQPEILKLDRALVHGADVDPVRQALARSLSWFARRTGAELVAEGIETRAELDTMQSLGVDFGQGFFLGRPLATAVT